MKLTTLMAALLVLGAAACEQKPQAEPTPTPAVAPPPPVAETTPASVNPDQAVLDQVPVPEDFEEQAARQITAETLDSELDKLEKEVAD
jgi:hypothetical protein